MKKKNIDFTIHDHQGTSLKSLRGKVKNPVKNGLFSNSNLACFLVTGADGRETCEQANSVDGA